MWFTLFIGSKFTPKGESEMLTVSVWVLDGKILSAFLDTPDGDFHAWHTGDLWPSVEDGARAEWQVRFIR